MDERYILSPGNIPTTVVAIFLLILSIYSWRRRSVPGALPLSAGALLATLWLLGMVMEAAAVAPSTKISWQKFQAVLQPPTVAASAFFALEYAQPGRWLTRRNLFLLSIPSMLVLLFVLFDESQLMWTSLQVAPDGTVVPQYALPGAILIGVVASFILINFAAFTWLFVRSPQHRWPIVFLIVGGVAGRILYLINAFRQPMPLSVDPLVVGFAFIWLMYAIVLFGFRIFDPLVAARHAVIEQMQAGVVVFDDAWRVIRLNPAAERIFGISADDAQGRSWHRLVQSDEGLPSLAEIQSLDGGKPTSAPELKLGKDGDERLYAPALSPLQDFHGLTVGHLLMLHDVTTQSRALAQLVEQQRALATLHERERLGRELHDSIGQVLGYASFQADAARQLIDGGKEEVAAEQLTRLAAVLQEAHADVREHILNLRMTPAPQQSFFTAVQDYLDGFMSNYGIETQYTVDNSLEEIALAPESHVQLFRILQEAMSNVRKHSMARHVAVVFENGQHMLRMTISDDGAGYDADITSTDDGNHMGLRFMRERVEELGGDMIVESSLGSGTRVTVDVPLEES